MKYRIISVLLILIANNALAQVQEGYNLIADVASFKIALRQASQSTSTIASDFAQERHLGMMARPLVSNGKFWFKKPASVRWEYLEPYSSIIIFNRNKAFIKDEEGSNEFDTGSGDVFKNLGDIMFRFILGDLDNAEEDYHVSYNENAVNYFVKLEPKIKTNMGLGAVDLYFDKSDFSLSKIIMYEEGNDFTAITFSNKTLNGSIRNDVFRMR